jgi:CBS domain-containing protein
VLLNGEVIGLLQLDAMTHHPPQEWPRVSVRQCMIPADRVVALTPGTSALAALDELVQHGAGRAVVLDGGELVGILSVTDLARALASGRPV